ncbi:hypothetical protein F2Q70_00041056 [Brassica cretica]|uniref:DYW domain-containing protein n=1 Tax=Brassica cretica TaxID=69181 RepID=A0A8S9K326_BRACR|nr:hypothetical protein F2Q70_00041056 [Brassica cretica]
MSSCLLHFHLLLPPAYQPLPFSRHKPHSLLRAAPTSSAALAEVSDAVFDVAPSNLISQPRSPEFWIDSLRSKVRSNLLREAVLTYIDMIVLGITPDNFAFPALLKAVADLRDADLGKQIHAHVYKFGGELNSFMVNTLVGMYGKLGKLGSSKALLGSFEGRDLVTWNTVLSSLCQNEQFLEALEYLREMVLEGVEPDGFTISSVLPVCSRLELLRTGKEMHAYALKNGPLDENSFVGSALVDMYCNCKRVVSARRVFDGIFDRRTGLWNAMIAGYAQNEHDEEALSLFMEMEENLKPNSITLMTILPSCAALSALAKGKEIHAYSIKNNLATGVAVGSALVDMYAKCGCLHNARKVFDQIPIRNVITWNVIIMAYGMHGNGQDAIDLLKVMMVQKVKPNEVTFIVAIACSNLSEGLLLGKQVHAFSLRKGELNSFMVNTLVGMYGKLGKLGSSKALLGSFEGRDLVTWNTVLSSLCQNEQFLEALEMQNFERKADLKPNSITLMTVLPSCAALSALAKGKEIHAYSIKNNLATGVAVGSALVDMYAKCGSLHNARKVFDQIPIRNVITWNVIIMAYGMHGNGQDAIDLLKMMMVQKVKPNEVTFISVFAACSHSGMVDEGLRIFYNMQNEYGFEPSSDHYACVVDLLGRAGRVEEAYQLINTMPLDFDKAGAWSSLLGACRIHNNLEIGEIAAQNLVQLEPDVASHYVLLANIYSSAGLWEKATEVRRKMKEKGVRKEPGCSWIEHGDEVHKFIAGDSSHPQSEKLHGYLEALWEKMRKEGYVPDTSCVLHNVEEDEKEVLLCGHSEKLAIAFGILNTSPGTVIRVAKNLRVCNDCHQATKFISKIVDREIILRDVRRFHHFKNGTCSCGDYW